MTPAEVAAVIAGAPERARYVDFSLTYYSNSRPGGVNVLCKRDTYCSGVFIRFASLSKREI